MRSNETTSESNATAPQRNEGSPAPLRISLASLLQPSSILDSLLETINCWLAVMNQRRFACQSANYNNAAWHTHETGIFKNVHSAAVSLAQATKCQRPTTAPAGSATSDDAHEEPDSVEFGTHLERDKRPDGRS